MAEEPEVLEEPMRYEVSHVSITARRCFYRLLNLGALSAAGVDALTVLLIHFIQAASKEASLTKRSQILQYARLAFASLPDDGKIRANMLFETRINLPILAYPGKVCAYGLHLMNH
jgi:hypothetical protein